MYYILDGKKVVSSDIQGWMKFMSTPRTDFWCRGKRKSIRRTKLFGVLISTVFLGIDHGFGKGKPVLFETMMFGDIVSDYQERYTTYDEAVKGHKFAVGYVIGAFISTKLNKLT